MIYLLVDDFSGRKELERIERAMGDPTTASLNMATFDGARLDLSDLKSTCEAMPFLSSRRLVIVRGVVGRNAETAQGENTRKSKGEFSEALVGYLANVPDFTDVVLLESEPPGKGALMRSVEMLASQGRASIRWDKPLDLESAHDWVVDRVKTHGGYIDFDAAHDVVSGVGVDRRALDREVEKLTLLVTDRQITSDDVRELVALPTDARIFDLIDALGNRNARRAIRAWRQLMVAGEDPYRIVSMVGRQVRLLVIASDGSTEGRSTQALSVMLGLPPRVAAGVAAQTRNWNAARLDRLLRRLVELDRESKTGGPDAERALQTLLLEVVAPRR